MEIFLKDTCGLQETKPKTEDTLFESILARQDILGKCSPKSNYCNYTNIK